MNVLKNPVCALYLFLCEWNRQITDLYKDVQYETNLMQSVCKNVHVIK